MIGNGLWEDKKFVIPAKTGIHLILFILTTSGDGTAVQAVNFSSLMTMIQKMVTQAIIDKAMEN